MFLEITAEEATVGEVVVPGNLLDALLAMVKLHLYVEDDVLVDDVLGCARGHLSYDVGEVLRGDVHLGGIVVDVP